MVESLNQIVDVMTNDANPGFDPRTSRRFETTALQGLVITEATPGSVKARLQVTPCITNRLDTLHGGAMATIVDVVTTLALATISPDRLGVSININTTYIRPVPVGDYAIIDASVTRVGKSVANLEACIKIERNNAVACKGTHLKSLDIPKSLWTDPVVGDGPFNSDGRAKL